MTRLEPSCQILSILGMIPLPNHFWWWDITWGAPLATAVSGQQIATWDCKPKVWNGDRSYHREPPTFGCRPLKLEGDIIQKLADGLKCWFTRKSEKGIEHVCRFRAAKTSVAPSCTRWDLDKPRANRVAEIHRIPLANADVFTRQCKGLGWRSKMAMESSHVEEEIMEIQKYVVSFFLVFPMPWRVCLSFFYPKGVEQCWIVGIDG